MLLQPFGLTINLQVQTMSGEIVQLVHLRSGDSSSYMGSWAPGSSDWEEVDIDEKERVGARRSPSPGMEGEFWMTYMDFIRTFTHLEVVHLDSETARDEPSMQGKNRWNMRFYSGAWQKGVTAGGCRNNTGNLIHLRAMTLIVSVVQTHSISILSCNFTCRNMIRSSYHCPNIVFLNRRLVNCNYSPKFISDTTRRHVGWSK